MVRGVRGDQAEDLRGGDRVAVVGVVEQEPAARGPGQRDQPAAVGEKGPQPHLVPRPAGPVAVDLPAGETGYLARRLLGPALHLGLVARRFRHPAAQVDHGGGGHRAEREQDPPGHVIAGPRAEQGQRDQRPDDQPEGLGAEHHPDQLAAVLPVRVLADHDRADRVVAADTEPEQETEPDQHRERPGQRRAQRPGDHEHGDQPVHPLAADHVRVPAEHHRAQERGRQHRAVEHGQLPRAQVPVLGDQRRGDPDDEQVVGVGEEPHPRCHHRPQVEPAQRGLIQRRDQVPGLDVSHRITPPLMPPDTLPASGRFPAHCVRKLQSPGEPQPT